MKPEGPDTPENGFLNRWARRKQAVQRQGEAAPVLRQAQDEGLQPHGNVEESTGEALPLPSLDDILPGTDVTAFFQAHVPEVLRIAALRKLWVTDPEISSFIEMAENQWDFNNPDSIPGWSSSVKGLDVKAMMERILNSTPEAIETTGPIDLASSAKTRTKEGAEQDEIPDAPSLEKPEISETSVALSKADEDASLMREEAAISHAAVQDMPAESDVYMRQKKRHGGALPT